MSHIAENGNATIEVVRLDYVVRETVSFIKMDLQRAEMFALKGSEKHTVTDCQELALVVDHHPSDYWRISQYAFGVCDDYRIFPGHYPHGWMETVVFII